MAAFQSWGGKDGEFLVFLAPVVSVGCLVIKATRLLLPNNKGHLLFSVGNLVVTPKCPKMAPDSEMLYGAFEERKLRLSLVKELGKKSDVLIYGSFSKLGW